MMDSGDTGPRRIFRIHTAQCSVRSHGQLWGGCPDVVHTDSVPYRSSGVPVSVQHRPPGHLPVSAAVTSERLQPGPRQLDRPALVVSATWHSGQRRSVTRPPAAGSRQPVRLRPPLVREGGERRLARLDCVADVRREEGEKDVRKT